MHLCMQVSGELSSSGRYSDREGQVGREERLSGSCFRSPLPRRSARSGSGVSCGAPSGSTCGGPCGGDAMRPLGQGAAVSQGKAISCSRDRASDRSSASALTLGGDFGQQHRFLREQEARVCHSEGSERGSRCSHSSARSSDSTASHLCRLESWPRSLQREPAQQQAR